MCTRSNAWAGSSKFFGVIGQTLLHGSFEIREQKKKTFVFSSVNVDGKLVFAKNLGHE